MKADEYYLFRFLNVSDLNFIIPIYQRNYDWKTEQCKQLFNDIENLINKNLNSHFFGSIVCKAENMNEMIIIDGQQRITTISLLLLAIYNYIHNENIAIEDRLDERILSEYLVNKYSPENKKIKLKPIKKDQEAFERLFENKEDEFIQDSHLTQNYIFLYNRVKNSKCSVNQLYNAITKLVVVKIELNQDDNPQLIFESMNSTGMDLSEADKIRNFILMDQSYELQKEYYEKYWNRIEENVNYNTTDFIKDYLTIKMSKIPTYNNIYKIFKEEFVLENKLEVAEVLKDMYIYSNSYNKVINANIGIKEIDRYLNDIVYLKYTLLYPFITQLINRYINKELSKENVEYTLKSLLTYIVRRIVCAKPTNALPKFFCTLDREIINIIEKENRSKEQYKDIFVYIIENRKGHVEFPRDEEFKNSFMIFKLYKMQNQVKNYMLRELENYDNKERITIKSIDEKAISIEHIMPQTLSPVWKNILGDNYLEIYEKYVDTIGNLTLTAYNSELQNKPFEEKKKIYMQSKLYLSSTIDNYQYWTEKEILDRANKLSNRALDVWKTPKTEYIKKENEDLIFDLSETDISFINTKIVAFKLCNLSNKEYEVTSWRDFEKKLILFLYDLDKIPLLKLMDKFSKDNEYSSKKFATIESELRTPLKIDDNVYVESHYNSDSLVDIVRLVVEAYNIKLEDVEIKLKENNTSKKGIYDIDTLSRNSSSEIKNLYINLDKKIMDLNSNIEKVYTKNYVAYRINQNFLELHFNKNKLTLYMFPNANYDDTKGKIEFIQDRTWILTARMYVKIDDDIEYITNMIKSSLKVIEPQKNYLF